MEHSTYRHEGKYLNDFSNSSVLDSCISHYTEIENLTHTEIDEAKGLQESE